MSNLLIRVTAWFKWPEMKSGQVCELTGRGGLSDYGTTSSEKLQGRRSHEAEIHYPFGKNTSMLLHLDSACGQVKGTYGLITDISDRNRQKQAFSEAELSERLLQLLNRCVFFNAEG